jgi:hypothetical protein
MYTAVLFCGYQQQLDEMQPDIIHLATVDKKTTLNVSIATSESASDANAKKLWQIVARAGKEGDGGQIGQT